MFDRGGGRKYLNGAERRTFLDVAEREPDPRRRAFCLTLLHTGCRISEALHVTAARLDVPQGSLVFETLKRRKRGVFRAVPIPDELVSLLGELTARIAPDERLWPFARATAYRLVKQVLADAGVTGGRASPRGLRHGFAVACIDRHIPLPTVQKWLGHARLETTAIYLGVSGEEERSLARRLWDSR